MRRSVVFLGAGIASAFGALQVFAQEPPAPDSQEATKFGYPSPAAALSALQGRPEVLINQQDGWTIAEDKARYTTWSFTLPGHEAHPAGIKRVLVKAANGDVSVMMTALCGAPRVICDKVISDFRALNSRMAESVREKLQGGK